MRVAGLTKREPEVMELVVAGHADKAIASRLGISQRTIMKKMDARSLSDLVTPGRCATGADDPSASSRTVAPFHCVHRGIAPSTLSR
jgi:DNA-binding CsgD family transcriptional regulator